MFDKMLNVLVWFSFVLQALGQKLFEFALKLALKHEKAKSKAAVEQPLQLSEEAVVEEPTVEHTMPEPQVPMQLQQIAEELPIFRGDNGKPVSMCFEPVPDFVVFEALFKRKYGNGGVCTMILNGQPRMFSVHQLYSLLCKIQDDPNAPAPLRALYGATMSVIVMREDEDIPKSQLN